MPPRETVDANGNEGAMNNSSLRRRRTLIATSCLVAAGALAPLTVRAADAANDAPVATASTSTVAPITVTAERRAVDIQKAALAISSVPAQQLDQSFVTNVAGLNGVVPSLEITKASGFENLVSIRG